MERCVNYYIMFWEELSNRTMNIEKVREIYNKILDAKKALRQQWKNIGPLVSKVTSLVALYSYYVENVEGDKAKAQKILQRTNEKRREGIDNSDVENFESVSAAYVRCSAELVFFSKQ